MRPLHWRRRLTLLAGVPLLLLGTLRLFDPVPGAGSDCFAGLRRFFDLFPIFDLHPDMVL